MQVQALLPLKDLVEAKSRLSGLLNPAQRRALTQAMVEDVLSVLAGHPDISTVTLVSDDPSANMLAAKYGIRHWLESTLDCRGLNRVITRSCELLLRESDQPVVVLHGDLPCLDAADITAVLQSLSQCEGLVVACDRHERGTNLLAFAPQNSIEFAFGSDSCARHCAAAKARGIPTQLLYRPGIALDIDEPQDLQLLMRQLDRGRSGHCSHLLSGTALGHRIRAQLASMESLPVSSTASPTQTSESKA